MTSLTLKTLIADVQQLTADEQFELVSVVLANLREQQKKERKPKQTLYGVVAGRGKAPSEEEIDEARHDLWTDFPRGDI